MKIQDIVGNQRFTIEGYDTQWQYAYHDFNSGESVIYSTDSGALLSIDPDTEVTLVEDTEKYGLYKVGIDPYRINQTNQIGEAGEVSIYKRDAPLDITDIDEPWINDPMHNKIVTAGLNPIEITLPKDTDVYGATTGNKD
jgi:hypothetical protein